MLLNQKISEGMTLADRLAAASQAAGTVTTPNWIAVQVYRRMMAKIETGVLGASATVDAKIRQAQDSSGTNPKDVTGKALTQIVKASGDNKIALINLNVDSDLDTTNGYGWVQVSVTVGTAASIVSAELWGLPGYETADQFNSASVVQIVG